MALTNERLREIVLELVSRPGHEKVRALVYEFAGSRTRSKQHGSGF